MISEAFRASVQKSFPVALSDEQLAVLYTKFRLKDSERVDMAKFLKESKKSPTPSNKLNRELFQSRKVPTSVLMGISQAVNTESYPAHISRTACVITYSSALARLHSTIKNAFPKIVSKKQLMAKCLQLIGWERGRSLMITQQELRQIFRFRFNLVIPETVIGVIFAELDPTKCGSLSFRKLLGDILRSTGISMSNQSTDSKGSSEAQVALNPDHVITEPLSDAVVDANRVAEIALPSLPITMLEDKIYDKISDGNVQGHSLQQCILRAFGDSRHRSRNDGITLDQFMFTVRVRFQIPVSKEDVTRLFATYDREGRGTIDMQQFAQQLIRTRQRNEPIITDEVFRRNHLLSDPKFTNCIEIRNLLSSIRDKLEEQTIRDARAPLLLVQTTGKLNRKQCDLFFSSRLQLKVSSEVLDILQGIYGSNNGTIDMPSLLADAVDKIDLITTINKDGQLVRPQRKHPSNVSKDFSLTGELLARPFSAPGGFGTISLSPRLPGRQGVSEIRDMPRSLQQVSKSTDDIRQLLQFKLIARCQSKNPMSVLHLVFKENGDNSRNTRYASKQKLREVLARNDIILSSDEFEAFFRQYALPENPDMFEVRELLLSLLNIDFDQGSDCTTSIVSLTDPSRLVVDGSSVRAGKSLLNDEQHEASQLVEKLLFTLTGPPTTVEVEARQSAPLYAEENHKRKGAMMSGSEMAWMLAGQPGKQNDEYQYGSIISSTQPPASSSTPRSESKRGSSGSTDVALPKQTDLGLTITPVRPSSAPSTASRTTTRRSTANVLSPMKSLRPSDPNAGP